MAATRAAYVVLRKASDGHWEQVGEIHRRPGITARVSRRHAIVEAISREPLDDEEYAVIPRSEWRVAQDW